MTIDPAPRLEEEVPAEWEVAESTPTPPPTLTAAVRDVLAARLYSRKATRNPTDRIVAAFVAGVSSLALDMTVEDVVHPPSVCMVGNQGGPHSVVCRPNGCGWIQRGGGRSVVACIWFARIARAALRCPGEFWDFAKLRRMDAAPDCSPANGWSQF